MFRRRFFLTMLLVLAGVAALGWKTGGEGRSLMPELSVSGAAGSLWSGARSSLAKAWDWAFGGSEDGSGWAAPDAGPWAGYQTTPAAPPTWSAPSYGAPAPNPGPNPAANPGPNPAALQTAAPAACLGDPRGAAMGGPFSLVGPNGRRVTSDSLKGQPLLIYFGFTFCPDICPVGLDRMSEATDILDKQGLRLTPVFITVDPERDTIPVMEAYAAHFHERLLALTGDAREIAAAADAYKVYYRKRLDPNFSDGYSMDHTGFTYFVDSQGRFRSFFLNSASAAEIAEGVMCAMRRG